MDPISRVSEELAYFTLAHKSANLPGFGRFEAIYVGAQIDPKSGQLLAPSEFIKFTDVANEDLEFVHHLQSNFPDQDLLAQFVTIVEEKLVAKEIVVLPDLGQLSRMTIWGTQFEYETELDFDLNGSAIKLNPISVVSEPTVVRDANAPGEAEDVVSSTSKGFPYLSLAAVAMVLAFALAVLFRPAAETKLQAAVQKVNVNISPADAGNEVITASIDQRVGEKRLYTEDKAEIVDRQEAMTAKRVEAPQKKASIVTNTFSNPQNIDKQIRLIEEYGYESDVLTTDMGLTSTLIILYYTNQADLEVSLEEIKKEFPRAKIQ